MEKFEKPKGFIAKTREEVDKMNEEEAKGRLRILDNEFQKISEEPGLDEIFYQARAPIDAEFSRIFDKFPELETWYENEL